MEKRYRWEKEYDFETGYLTAEEQETLLNFFSKPGFLKNALGFMGYRSDFRYDHKKLCHYFNYGGYGMGVAYLMNHMTGDIKSALDKVREHSHIRKNIVGDYIDRNRIFPNEEILLVKLWAKCHKLNFPDVCVEIMVAKSRKGNYYREIVKKGLRNNYYRNFFEVLLYIRDNILTEEITLPSYLFDNVPDISIKDRRLIRKCAKESLKQSRLKEIVWEE